MRSVPSAGLDSDAVKKHTEHGMVQAKFVCHNNDNNDVMEKKHHHS